MDAIISFLKSTAGLVTAIAGLLAAIAGLITAARQLRSNFPKKVQSSSPVETSTLSSSTNRFLLILSVFLFVLFLMGLTISFGLITIWRPQSLTLSGSTNVYGFIAQNYPAALTKDVSFEDNGSENALEDIFAVFDYGRRISDNDRKGRVAISSSGDHKLKDLVRTSPNVDFTKDNYWLSITMSRRPLMVLYRNLPEGALKVERAAQYPPQGKNSRPSSAYNFVRPAELKRFFSEHPTQDIKLFLPEEKTGTRSVFDATRKVPFTWPAAESLPTYIDQFDGAFPMLTVLSELPASKANASVTDRCQALRSRRLNVALLCADDTVCGGFPSAEFAVVVKVKRELGASRARFTINSEAECRFIRSIEPSINHTCELPGNEGQTHIIEVSSAGANDLAPPPIALCGT